VAKAEVGEMTKSTIFVLILITGGLLAIKLLVLFFEPRLTFFPTRGLINTPGQMGIPFREVSIRSDDGETICAWFLEQSEPVAELVFFHGNAGNLSLWQDFLISMYQHSFTVFAIDYRGYGKSTGSPTEQGVYLDAEALLQHFWDEIHSPGHKVIYWGRSLGGAVAAFASRVRQPDGLILEGTFPSLSSLLNHYPLLKVFSLFSTYRFATLEQLETVSCPVLILHGDRDEVVPLEQGKSLFDKLNMDKKYLHIVSGAHHNDIQYVDPENYWNRVIQFAEKLNDGQDLP
jgi:uncharacterized protein